MNYQEILKNFGTPLSQLPNSNGHGPWKTWQIVGGIAVLSLAVYGGYKLCMSIQEIQYPKVKDPKK